MPGSELGNEAMNCAGSHCRFWAKWIRPASNIHLLHAQMSIGLCSGMPRAETAVHLLSLPVEIADDNDKQTLNSLGRKDWTCMSNGHAIIEVWIQAFRLALPACCV